MKKEELREQAEKFLSESNISFGKLASVSRCDPDRNGSEYYLARMLVDFASELFKQEPICVDCEMGLPCRTCEEPESKAEVMDKPPMENLKAMFRGGIKLNTYQKALAFEEYLALGKHFAPSQPKQVTDEWIRSEAKKRFAPWDDNIDVFVNGANVVRDKLLEKEPKPESKEQSTDIEHEITMLLMNHGGDLGEEVLVSVLIEKLMCIFNEYK